MTNTIGLFGGTFDPIHYGHIRPIENIAEKLALESVYLLPNFIPPHKSQAAANHQHRHAMLSLVCQHHRLFKLDDRELKRSNTSYTIDTLNEIKAASPSHHIIFFIGMDSLLNFTTWYQWQEILNLCHLVVSSRPQYSLENLTPETQRLLSERQVDDLSIINKHPFGKIAIIPEANYDISSTQIRTALKNQQPLPDLLPPFIQQYILDHQLYR